VGTSGNDVLYESASGSKMTGGAGADKFVFTYFVAGNTITDFRIGQDKVDLSAFHLGASALKDGHAWLVKAGGDTKVYVDLDAGGMLSSLLLVTLTGVQSQKMSAGDFLFG
jgi:Ca2+-binding RTX toxin-like protein